MNDDIEDSMFVQNIGLLYELSLAIGSSLDVKENCALFLERLVARINLASTAVWIKDSYLAGVDSDGATLVYANPELSTGESHLPLSHPYFSLLGEKPFISVDVPDKPSGNILTDDGLGNGANAIFALGQIGLLKLMSVWQDESYEQMELAGLQNVIDQFALSLEGCLAHQRVKNEIGDLHQVVTKMQQVQDEREQQFKERSAKLMKINDELLHLSRLKDDFLANMSHELRTPLNAILALAESLQAGTYGTLSEKQALSIERMEKSGHHLLSLINDILDVSKIESGEFDLNWEHVSVPHICQASLEFTQQEAHKKNIKVFTTFDHEVDIVRADERRLKQILANLLTNAVKFTPEGGQIRLEVMGDAPAGVVCFTVEDTGIGIAPEEMGQLFNPFIQLENSMTRQGQGTGLGLSLVKGLVEKHNGKVVVASEVGQGSRFTVTLPWQRVDDPVEQSQKDVTTNILTGPSRTRIGTTPLPPGHAPILLAEDNQENAETIIDYLQSHDFEIILARNGRQAVEKALNERPSLILMDIQMPGMDGLDAIKHIRSERDLAHTPIIALTALAMPGDRERCLAAGANDYLSKPVSLENLARVIKKHLKRTAKELEEVKETAVSPPAATQIEPKPEVDETGTKAAKLVMFVDDDAVNLAAYMDVLEISGYRGISAGSGLEAIALVQTELPDLIIMDVNMPDLDGLEATRRLRSEEQTAEIPIILVTGLTSEEDKQRGLASGAVEYLTKPIGLNQLMQLIEQYVN